MHSQLENAALQIKESQSGSLSVDFTQQTYLGAAVSTKERFIQDVSVLPTAFFMRKGIRFRIVA